jgi:lysophospholipase L1-like esterase/uncharacterized protein YjfI (DUF2170 family)
MIYDIPGQLKNLLPKNIDSLRGPYPTLAAANAAILNNIVVVDGVPLSYRLGKFVEIGTQAPYVTYWWNGTDYADDKLVEYFGNLAKNTDLNNIIGSISSTTSNNILAITTAASDSDVSFFNFFDWTRAATYNKIKVATNIAGNVTLVKSNADYSVVTDILTFAVPGGIFDYSFTSIPLAIGEKLGVRSIGSTCKLLYISSSGVGFHSMKGTGANVANQEIGYQLFGTLTTYSSLSDLTLNAAALAAKQIADKAELLGAQSITDRATNTAFSAMTSSGGNGTVYINNFPIPFGTQDVVDFTTRLAVSSPVTLVKCNQDFTSRVDLSTFTIAAGVVTTAFAYKLAAGERLGMRSANGIFYKGTGGVGCFDAGVGSLSAALEVAFTYRTKTAYKSLVDLNATVSTNETKLTTAQAAIVTAQTAITALQSASTPVVPDENILYSDPLTTEANFTKIGWTFASGKFTSVATGVENRLQFNQKYNIDKRAMRFYAAFSADCDFRIHNKYGSFSQGLIVGVGASMFGVDVAANKINMYRAAGANPLLTSTGVTTTVQETFTIPFTLVATRKYLIEQELNINVNSLRITDTLTGDTFNAVSVGGWLTGQQSDFYGFFVNSGGSVDICDKLDVRCTLKKVDTVAMGDSITKGEQVTDKTGTFGNRLRALNPNTFVVSARGGSTIDDLIVRLNTEIIFLKPKTIMVTIGANGGNTTGKIQTIADFCITNNIKLVLNHVSCLRADDQHIAINAMIDTFNKPGVKFDVATALGNYPLVDGTHVSPRANPALFSADLVHPVDAGQLVMFNRIRLDAPYLLSA